MIRLANEDDKEEIVSLLQDVFSEPPFNEKESLESIRKSVEFYFRIGNFFVFCENEILGLIIFKVEQWWEGPVVIIEDLAVKRRSEGIGTALMQKVEKYARQISAESISLCTKKEVVPFYIKQDYQEEDTVCLKKKLR
ncbi:MAG: GNAT family N-acetyltransferase [Candidatus Woesearchaeota archaeon]